MLLHLHVKNLALIRETEIDFTEGLNILTGETGAGKSIIIDSITMALGGKISKEMIRQDADYALIELVFLAENEILLKRLEELEIPVEDGQLILSRKISGGRSICRLNGETVSSAVLKEVASYLIDIHGQHEHQSLLHKKKHLEILDTYAQAEFGNLKEELSKTYREYQKLKKEFEQSSMDENSRIREQSLLEFEIEEIEAANLQIGEDDKLEQTYRKMLNGKHILEALHLVKFLCMEAEQSAGEQTSRACRELVNVVCHDKELESLSEQLQQIDGMLADFGRELSSYMQGLEFSEQEFSEIEERFNQLNHLKMKYGQSIEEILKYQEEKQKRLDILLHFEQYMEKTKKELKALEAKIWDLSKRLHQIRKKAADELAELMRAQLAELNFLDVKFEISVQEIEQFGANGFDEVEFLISTNPGEPLKPLGKIASGGELSRVMLAIKTVLASQDAIDTLIFDEIDTGISGRTAQKISEKLALIGKSRQVICITHLAQLASMADSHYCIEKQAVDGSTRTEIKKLQEEEVIEELARILGGAKITEAVRDNAREMKNLAKVLKSEVSN